MNNLAVAAAHAAVAVGAATRSAAGSCRHPAAVGAVDRRLQHAAVEVDAADGRRWVVETKHWGGTVRRALVAA